MEMKIEALILVVCYLCLKFCEGVDTARNDTYAENSIAHLTCHVELIEPTVWLITRRNENAESISQGSTVYPIFQDKYGMEVLSHNSSSHVLKLKFNVTIEDEGQYFCQEFGKNKAQYNLIVEVPPELQLKRDNAEIGTNTDVVANKQVTIECIADGGKPLVSLSWEVNGKKKTGPFIDHTTFDSEMMVTSVIHYIPTEEDNTLACVASGQKAIPDQKVSVAVNVQYAPNCVMAITNTTNAFVISCSCKANPRVSRYEIYVNGSLFSEEMEATLPSEKSARVFCNATNDIGSFPTGEESLKPFHEEVPIQLSGKPLIIGLSVTGVTLFVLILIAVLAICKYQKGKSMYQEKKKDAEDKATNLQRQAEAIDMANKELPEEYDTKYDEDDEPKQKADEETDGKSGSEEKSKASPEINADGNVPVIPSPEKENNQEYENLIRNTDKGTEREPNKEASNESDDQKAGNNQDSTPDKEESNQECERLIHSADTA